MTTAVTTSLTHSLTTAFVGDADPGVAAGGVVVAARGVGVAAGGVGAAGGGAGAAVGGVAAAEGTVVVLGGIGAAVTTGSAVIRAQNAALFAFFSKVLAPRNVSLPFTRFNGGMEGSKYVHSVSSLDGLFAFHPLAPRTIFHVLIAPSYFRSSFQKLRGGGIFCLSKCDGEIHPLVIRICTFYCSSPPHVRSLSAPHPAIAVSTG